jgi:hypothetical protein
MSVWFARSDFWIIWPTLHGISAIGHPNLLHFNFPTGPNNNMADALIRKMEARVESLNTWPWNGVL